MSILYPLMLGAELESHAWKFAFSYATVTWTSTLVSDDDTPYVFDYPTDCLRPIKRDGDLWKSLGRQLLSPDKAAMKILFIRNDVTEDLFPYIFANALAGRIAWEGCEQITQSNTKKKDALEAYSLAISMARKANAILDPVEDTQDDDSAFSWLQSRYYPDA